MLLLGTCQKNNVLSFSVKIGVGNKKTIMLPKWIQTGALVTLIFGFGETFTSHAIEGHGPSQALTTSARQNIVFILTDDLSLNLVQYMPHVLKMQKDGVTFANYFVTDSRCCPSRSSIFTGLFPHDTGVLTNTGDDGGYLVFRNRGHEGATFATALSAAGYRTAMLGKYLNEYNPKVHPAAPGWTTWAVAGYGYDEFNYDLRQDSQVAHHGSKSTDYLTDVLSSLAVRFIKEKPDQPFLIEVATFAPHSPFTPAPRDADAFRGLRAPRTPAFNVDPDANAPKWLREIPPLTEDEMTRIDTNFRKRARSVLAVDKMIGELQAAVAAIGQEKNTFFIFSSDNGLHMGEHRLREGKMTAFDIDIHVPLIVTGPGVPAGLTVDEIVENIDLCPTFTELAGAVAPANVDGHSLVPLLHGQVTEWRSAALIEHHGSQEPSDPDAPDRYSGDPPTYEAIRTRTSLYIEYATGEKEYHNLITDMHELRNTFPSLPAEEKKLLHAVLDAIKNCHDAKTCWAAELAHGANLLVNGSFEEGPSLGDSSLIMLSSGSTDIVGWTVGDNGIDYAGPGTWNISDGVRNIDLDGSKGSNDNGAISQTFATTAGQQYIVNFDLSGNPASFPLIKQVEVSAGANTQVFTYDIGSLNLNSNPLTISYTPETFFFTATGDSSTLTFRSLTYQTGYTSYGSIIDNVVVNELPDLIITRISDIPDHKKRGGKFTIIDVVKNQGTAEAGQFTNGYYLSIDEVKSDDDIEIEGNRNIPSLDPGKSSSKNNGVKPVKVKIPSDAPLGEYYIIVCADSMDQIAESYEANNCMASKKTITVHK